MDPEVTLLTFLRKNRILLIKVWAVSVFTLKLKPAVIVKDILTSLSLVSPIGPCCLFAFGSGFKDIKLIGLFQRMKFLQSFLYLDLIAMK